MRAKKTVTCIVTAVVTLGLAACDPGKASQAGHKNDKGKDSSKVKIVTGDNRKGKRLSKPQSLGRSCGYNHRNDTAPQKGHTSHIVTCKFNAKTHLWEWM